MSFAAMQDRMAQAAGQAAAKEGASFAQEQLQLRWPACRFMSTIRTVLGCILVFSIWSTAIDSLFGICVFLGIYLLILAIPVTMLEFEFLINKVGCCEREGFCCNLWKVSRVFADTWKRGVVYCLLSILLFIPPFLCFWGVVTAMLFVVTGVLYILKKFQYTNAPPADNFSGATVQDPSQFQQIP